MGAEGKWFVMMYSQNGQYVMPLVDEDENVLLFDSKEEAKDVGDMHHFANKFGFFVCEVGGEYV